MARRFTIAIAVVAAVTLSAFGTIQAGRAQNPTDAERRIVTAAEGFLATLDAAQRTKANLPLNATSRTVWSNLPTGITLQSGATERNGLKLGDMTPAQEKAALALVAAALSADGYRKVMQIVDADEVLEQRSVSSRAATSRIRFGRREFYLSILGKVSTADPWMLQFGGHHLAINVTFAGRTRVLTPTHTGAQPATYSIEGRTVRPLGDENDKAFALVNSLTPEQRKPAVLGVEVRNLVLGPGEDGKHDCARRREGLDVHRLAARATARPDRGMGRHHRRRCLGGEDGGRQDDARRHLVRMGGRHHQRERRLLPHSGSERLHRVRAAGQREQHRSHPHHLSGSVQRLRGPGDRAMTRVVASLVLVIAAATGADAHRLDEYLQAARVAVTPRAVVVHLDLTPGVSLAADVISLLDRDGDGRVSPIEAEAYGRACWPRWRFARW